MLEIYVSTECLELNEGIIYPENSKHPIKQVEWVKELLKGDWKDKKISTNSPYILQAVRYYSAKNKIEDQVVYYNVTKEGVRNITNTLNDIFTTFAAPLNNIMNVDQVRFNE